MSRDIHSLPPSKLRKRELRALITEMRLREVRTFERILAKLPPELAIEIAHELVRDA